MIVFWICVDEAVGFNLLCIHYMVVNTVIRKFVFCYAGFKCALFFYLFGSKLFKCICVFMSFWGWSVHVFKNVWGGFNNEKGCLF
jgi:hypothetical protein